MRYLSATLSVYVLELFVEVYKLITTVLFTSSEPEAKAEILPRFSPLSIVLTDNH